MCSAQIDEDTDRDRYMSPLEAKQYGLIDQVIGGDDAGFKVGPRSPRCAILLHTLPSRLHVVLAD